MRPARLLWACLLASALAACAHTPAPMEETRAELTPADWKEQVSPDIPITLAWSDFSDPILAELIDVALQNNPGVLSAVESLAASRLGLRESRAARRPGYGIDAGASVTEARGAGTTSLWSLGAAASYEVDLWGRLSDDVELAELGIVSSELGLLTTRISLAAEVAGSYFALRATDEFLRLRERSLANALRQRDFIAARHEAGVTSGIDLDQQEVRVQSLRAGIEDLKAERSRQEQRLAVLTGRPPGALELPPERLDARLPRLAPGTPAEVLLTRPDIRDAEVQLASAYIRIDQARTAFFPTVRLSGDTGFASSDLKDLLTNGAFSWSGGLNAVTTLLDNGARRRTIERSEIAARQQVLRYRQTILAALEEVENALIAQETNIRQTDIQRLQLAAQERVTRETEARYRAGTASAFDLVRQQDALLSSQEQSVNIWVGGINATISLMRALAVAP